MICSGVNDLPVGIDFDLAQSTSFSQSKPQSSQQSISESTLDEEDSQSTVFALQEVLPTTSFTLADEPVFKKPKNQRGGGQRKDLSLPC